MKLYKFNLEKAEVVCVEGGVYPARDQDGDVCYHNTHFETEGEARESIRENLKAAVEFAEQKVSAAEMALENARFQLHEITSLFARVLIKMESSKDVRKPA